MKQEVPRTTVVMKLDSVTLKKRVLKGSELKGPEMKSYEMKGVEVEGSEMKSYNEVKWAELAGLQS